MAIYRIQGPDGTIYKLEGPDDATAEELEAAAAEHFGGKGPVQAPTTSPTPSNWFSTPEVLAAMGTGALAQPIAGLAGLGATLIPGADAAEVVEKVKGSMTYEPKTEYAQKALEYAAIPFEALKRGAGSVGEYLGSKLGAPEAGETIGEVVGEALPQVLPLVKGLAKGKPVPARAKLVSEARKAGYTVPPSFDPGASRVSTIAEKISGRRDLTRAATERNLQNSMRLVKKDLGIPKDAPLDLESVQKVRADAGKVYEDLKGQPFQISATHNYLNKVQNLGKGLDAALTEFPELFKNQEVRELATTLSKAKMTPEAAVEAIKKLRSDSKINFRAYDKPYQQALAKAQLDAATALEDLIEVNLRRQGNRQLVSDFKEARTKIAKAHDVESAMNEVTGEIDAKALGRTLKKRKQMTGELGEVARFARTFPEIAGGAKPYVPNWVDIMREVPLGAGATAAYGTGRPGLGTAILALRAAQPALRQGLASRPYQSGALNLLNPIPALPYGASGLSMAIPPTEENTE